MPVFGFLRKSGPRSPSAAIRRAIEDDGLPAGVDRASALAVIERRDRYAGRAVTSFRVFEPARAHALGVTVRAFGDLDAHPSLILKSGHIEGDGRVTFTARASGGNGDAPTRTVANRTGRDDEDIVFRSTGR